MREEEDPYTEYEEYWKSVDQRAGVGCLVAVIAFIVITLAWCIYSLFFNNLE